jgi:hypothetical protein
MSAESRRLAGILLVVFPTVVSGGLYLVSALADPVSGYKDNPLRQDLFRAGHAHAGVLLILSLVILRYVDEAALPGGVKRLVRVAVPTAAILMPTAFFFSVLAPSSTRPNGLIYLAYAGAACVAAGLVVVGVGLLRKPRTVGDGKGQG